MPHIAPLGLGDLDPFVRHMQAHAAESGRDGDPIFMPWGREKPLDLADFRMRRRARVGRSLDEDGWERAWGLFDGEAIGGHVQLLGSAIPAARHRASVGMGLERAWRRRGWGEKLLTTALDWAREQTFLDWVDLGVFGENVAAHALYTKLGFRETGRVEDRYRVDGETIDDIEMTLWVGAD